MCVKPLTYVISFNPDENGVSMRKLSLGTIAQGHIKLLNRGSNLGLADSQPGFRGCPVILVNTLSENKANWLSLTLDPKSFSFTFCQIGRQYSD